MTKGDGEANRASRSKHNLPYQLTGFVGREQEHAQLKELATHESPGDADRRWRCARALLKRLGSRCLLKPISENQARSKRSKCITLVQAATKSFTNFSFESAHA